MAIDTSKGGLQKPISKTTGILWYADAGDVALSAIDASSDLSTLGLTEAGAVTVDGITMAANSEEPEVYLDWNGNAFDSGEAVSTPSVTFALLEVLNADAAKLVFDENSLTIDGVTGALEGITGNSNPTNKMLVIDTRIKNTRVRVILPEASFASRGDDAYANDALYSWEVTYNILVGTEGVDIERKFSEIA